MFKYVIQKLTLIIIIILLFGPGLIAQKKHIKITGLKFYTEEQLFQQLHISQTIPRKYDYKSLVKNLKAFYKKNGFIIAKIYIAENTPEQLWLHIDEGKLDKIIIINLAMINTFIFRYSLNFKNKIFNKNVIAALIKAQKDTYTITYKLKLIKGFNESIFQLDQELNLPIIGKTYLPFFNEYKSRYDLFIYVEQKKITNHSSELNSKNTYPRYYEIDYKLKTKYATGFIPTMSFNYYNLMLPKDSFTIKPSVGIMYGFDGKFNQPPRESFFETVSAYTFCPIKDIFTPGVDGKIYHSRASRADLGLKQYKYWLIRGAFSPGITLLRYWKVSTSIGKEVTFFRESKIDPDSDIHIDIEKKMVEYYYVAAKLRFGYLPLTLGFPQKKDMVFSYYYYFNEDTFHKFNIDGRYKFEHRGKNIFRLRILGNYLWGDVPFHHEAPVSSNSFKGFGSLSYYTRENISLSNEYSISIYRDYIYLGLFVDTTSFKGSGHDLIGWQYGIAVGPSVRLLFFDQFEFYFYISRDYLYSTGDSHNNIFFTLYKKW